MYLINVHTLELEHFPECSSRVLKGKKLKIAYAILSHRWVPTQNEILFQEAKNGFKNRRGPVWAKIKGCLKQAKRDGLEYVWIDSCCIDKRKDEDHLETINLMFRWYEESEVCYVYLYDVESTNESFLQSEWFERGWTLQELLAPRVVKFFNQNWEYIGTKKEWANELEYRTGIPKRVLNGSSSMFNETIEERMSWINGRVTTNPEDLGYCMLGILGQTQKRKYKKEDYSFRRVQRKAFRPSHEDPYLTDTQAGEEYFPAALSESMDYDAELYEPYNNYGDLAYSNEHGIDEGELELQQEGPDVDIQDTLEGALPDKQGLAYHGRYGFNGEPEVRQKDEFGESEQQSEEPLYFTNAPDFDDTVSLALTMGDGSTDSTLDTPSTNYETASYYDYGSFSGADAEYRQGHQTTTNDNNQLSIDDYFDPEGIEAYYKPKESRPKSKHHRRR